MPDLNGTLDTVLGFVTIVLVLSLIIQSLQNIIKRLLKMKSRQAEQSLRLLFDYVLHNDPSKYTGIRYASPVLHAATKLFGRDKGIADSIVKAVKAEVLEVGRKSFWGKAVLDSVSKDDLIKILNRFSSDPNIDEKVKEAIDGKIGDIATWYDTVMPGLAERHERGMKWLSVFLSALIVVLFNANAVAIFRYVSSDPAVQKQLSDYGQTLAKEREKTNIQPADPSESDEAKFERLKKETKDDINKVKSLSSELGSFGLTPPKGVGAFWENLQKWRANLLGWLAMVLLLSMGAPFWEDALGSLFGLKNALGSKAKDEQKKNP